jgi:hypothetical protein
MNKCIAIITSGLKKNNICNRKVKYEMYCGIHKKYKQNNIENITNSLNTIKISENNTIKISENNTIKISENNTNHEIYIIQLAEHIRCKDNIYKIGMTKRGSLNRLKGYPKNSKLLYSIKVKDAKLCEREVMKKCRETSGIINCDKNHSDEYKRLGNEYFEGNYESIKKIVEEACKNFNEKYIK